MILGPSQDGQWLLDEEHAMPNKEEDDKEDVGQSKACTLFIHVKLFITYIVKSARMHFSPDHMYYYEGKDYSKDPSTDDQKTFDLLLEEQFAQLEDAGKEGHALRRKTGVGLQQ